MQLRKLTRTWEILGRDDPLWAVLTEHERRGQRWDPAAFFATGRAEVAQLAQQLERAGLRLQGKRALDFGCGVGRITQALAGCFTQVDGVDISAAMLQQAERFNRAEKACRFTLNSRADLALFPDGAFDFVYSRIVLQHMPVRLARQYLAEFNRVLRPGGILFFQMPAGRNLSDPDTLAEFSHHVTIPRRIYKIIRRVVLFDWRPKRPRGVEMEMHFLPVAEVARLLDKLGLQLVEVVRDEACGKMVHSYAYLAVKPTRPPAWISNWTWSKVNPPR